MTALDSANVAPLPAEPPQHRSATQPPEARGLRRDEVRLLVVGDGPLQHALFRDLPSFLAPGDVLVVNTSATLPSAVDGRYQDGTPVRLHLAALPDGQWAAEVRTAGGGRFTQASAGDTVVLAGNVTARLDQAYPHAGSASSRLWRITLPVADVAAYLDGAGRPITYDYIRGVWPLPLYQTVFARHPGSAEMPSAGRPFSPEVVTELVAAGVVIAPVTLHTGLSSLDSHETPLPEWFEVPESTARVVNASRVRGGRIVAVGTTVTRALESVAEPLGTVHPGSGWTDLVLGPQRPARVVNGLVTGWHDADASHLLLLEAVAGAATVAEAYEAAAAQRYYWHEFGDACLFLPSGERGHLSR